MGKVRLVLGAVVLLVSSQATGGLPAQCRRTCKQFALVSPECANLRPRLFRACRTRLVKRCKQEGLDVCAVSPTSTTSITGTTALFTTTSSSSGTSSTISTTTTSSSSTSTTSLEPPVESSTSTTV